MGNIWDFLLQTMEVTLAAAFILILKWMFLDKLSPRWQYGIWTILAVKLVLPAGFLRSYISLDLAAALQVLKMNVECQMESQFSDVYDVIRPSVGFPTCIGAPQSITDWLFLLYIAGAAMMALYYIFGYLRLRVILRKGWQPEEATCCKVNKLCETYCLKPCRIRILDGIDSAFVCGFLNPVFVIPAEQEENIDEKIILHELMHEKYFDAWQNGFWCFVRCIHWCNPVLQYVMNRIGNDMESLCDQRVLERIEGEERRDYGRILLAMTNQKYARALGTTSLSNGGRNIKRRIEAIVRFKKYPKGMALVSICVCLLMAMPVFGGTRQMDVFDDSFSWSSGDVSLAKIHLQGCTTAAGAIDCYTKGMLQGNRQYLAAALPAEQQAKVKDIAESSPLHPEYDSCFVVNLNEKDGVMHPYVLLCSEGEGTNDELPYKVAALPLEVKKENHRWVVSGYGEPICYRTEDRPQWNYQKELPALGSYEAECETGSISLKEQSYHYITSSQKDSEWDWFGYDSTSLSQWADPDADFGRHELHYVVKYEHDMTKSKGQVDRVALSGRVLTDEEPNPDWSRDGSPRESISGESGSSDGAAMASGNVGEDWKGSFWMKIGYFDQDDNGLEAAKAYAIRVYINRMPQGSVQIERGDQHEQ